MEYVITSRFKHPDFDTRPIDYIDHEERERYMGINDGVFQIELLNGTRQDINHIPNYLPSIPHNVLLELKSSFEGWCFSVFAGGKPASMNIDDSIYHEDSSGFTESQEIFVFFQDYFSVDEHNTPLDELRSHGFSEQRLFVTASMTPQQVQSYIQRFLSAKGYKNHKVEIHSSIFI